MAALISTGFVDPKLRHDVVCQAYLFANKSVSRTELGSVPFSSNTPELRD